MKNMIRAISFARPYAARNVPFIFFAAIAFHCALSDQGNVTGTEPPLRTNEQIEADSIINKKLVALDVDAQQGEFLKVVDGYVEIVQLITRVYGPNDFRVRYNMRFLESYRRLAAMDENVRMQFASAARGAAYGIRICRAGMYGEAHNYLRTHWDLCQRHLGPHDALTWVALHSLGLNSLVAHDARAKEYLENTLAASIVLFGESHPSVAGVRCDFGHALGLVELHALAEEQFIAAAKIQSEHFGIHDLSYHTTMTHLGAELINQKKYDDTIAWLTPVTAQPHPTGLTSINLRYQCCFFLAMAYKHTKNEEKAAIEFEKAVNLYETRMATGNRGTYPTLLRMYKQVLETLGDDIKTAHVDKLLERQALEEQLQSAFPADGARR